MSQELYEKIIRWKWTMGMPVEKYTNFQIEFFNEIVKEFELPAFDIEVFASPEIDFNARVAKSKSVEKIDADSLIFRRIKFPGGIIGPHFHLEGKVYLLNEKQWNKVSSKMVDVFQERLGRAGSINMEQFAKMNDALTKL